MYSSIIKYAIITSLALSGSMTEPAIAPNESIKTEVISSTGTTNTGKIVPIPIVQNWKTRMRDHDSSITVFVSKTIGLYRKNYEPSDLVSIS